MKLNDVVLAICSGALRSYLAEHHALLGHVVGDGDEAGGEGYALAGQAQHRVHVRIADVDLRFVADVVGHRTHEADRAIAAQRRDERAHPARGHVGVVVEHHHDLARRGRQSDVVAGGEAQVGGVDDHATRLAGRRGLRFPRAEEVGGAVARRVVDDDGFVHLATQRVQLGGEPRGIGGIFFDDFAERDFDFALRLVQSVATGIELFDLAALPRGVAICNAFGHETAIADAPAAYFSTLPVKAMLARLRALGIEVLDEGPGPAPGEEEAVFERFRRGSASKSSSGTGRRSPADAR